MYVRGEQMGVRVEDEISAVVDGGVGATDL
jgi:hypothetical protein